MMTDKIIDFFNEIKNSAEEIESIYFGEVLKKCNKKVVSKGPLYNVRPYEYQRAGFETGKELKTPPKSLNNVYNYHFDIDGNILLIESYGQKGNIINREYFIYEEGSIKSIYFNNKVSLRNVNYSKISNELIVEDINYGKFGVSTYTYEYKDNLLSKINVSQKEHHQQDYSNYVIEFEYDEHNLIKIIHRFPNGHIEQRYP